MPAASTHKQIADAVAAVIAAAGLVDYPDGNAIGAARVLVRWGIEVQPNDLPAIFVQPNGNKSIIGGTNERDDVAYPIRVDVVDRQSILEPDAMDAVLFWREVIESKFRNQRLSTIAFNCLFDTSPILDAAWASKYQLVVEPLFFRFIVRQARG